MAEIPLTASNAPVQAPRAGWLVAAGLLALYLPTLHDLVRGAWRSEDQSYGPFILLAVIWLFWSRRQRIAWSGPPLAPAAMLIGTALLAAGLLLYVLGRSQGVLVGEVGSLPPVLAGALLLTGGARALRALWFALLYLLFLIPLPGVLVDALTGTLKQWVSVAAEQLLYGAGYPVARNGVMLTMGQYQLLVADACSGLHSLYALAALGALFIYLMHRRGALHNALMLASVLPIAFAANVARVVILCLITYHWGDAAAQGALHGAIGMLLFAVALLLLFALDALLNALAALAARRPAR